MYRSADDIALLAELAGVLDEPVSAAGLSSGTYLILREIVAAGGALPVTELGARLAADPQEVAQLAGWLAQEELVSVGAGGLEASLVAIARVNDVESRANEAMRSYVLDRPHSPTVYGLVAAMQTGRFTVEDLIDFINESDQDETPDDGSNGSA